MLDLTTPSVRTDQRLAGEFRPRTLETWLAQLPRTDRESCLQQMYRALGTQNRVALEPAVRVQLMELYLVPFRELFVLHHSDLRTISRVPMHPHYRARQEEMLAMLDAMAAGYKIVALDMVSRGRGHGRDNELALALQRAMYLLGEILVTAYELYIRPPAGAWREVHALYRCAEDENLSGADVAPPPGVNEKVNILRTYVPILLLGASCPHGLLPGEARRLYELVPQWRRSARIITPATLPEDPGHYRFNLDADAPPFPVSKSNRPLDGATRVVRTLGVARAAHQVLTDLNNAATQKAMRKVLGPGMEAADIEMFRRAGRVFGEVDIKRSSNRFAARQELELYAGFDAVYYACNDRRALDPPAAVESEPAAGLSPQRSDEQFIDLSEPMLGAPINGGPQEQPGGPAPGRYVAQRARSANQSAGGMCLVQARSDDARVKVDDITACRNTGGGPDWQLGVVRWMRIGSKEVRFGLQFLGPVAVPVTATIADGGKGNGQTASGTDTVAAIWLPENPALKQAHSVVLPRAAEPYPPELAIRGDAGVPERIRLLRRVERTGDYEQFLVSLDPFGADPQSSLSS